MKYGAYSYVFITLLFTGLFFNSAGKSQPYNILPGNGIGKATGNEHLKSVPGSDPCTAIVIDTAQCILTDNSGMPGTGWNGCPFSFVSDMWFSMQVPPSGNVSLVIDSAGLMDTGMSVWTGTSCTGLTHLKCNDDGNGIYSLIFLYDLVPAQTIYIQLWGYFAVTGPFRLCAKEIPDVTVDSTELPLVLINSLGQVIVEDTKINALMDVKFNGPGTFTYVTDSSNVYSGNIGIEIRGTSSAHYPQPPYSIETRDSSGLNNNVSILGMPAENDWVLLSNFNDRSLLRNALAFKLFGDMGHYSPRTSFCEVMVDSSYMGIYAFGERIKRDNNRVDIAKLTSADSTGDQLTGGYILEQNYWNAFNSFQSNYSPIDHPGFDVHFVYGYPKADSITIPQKAYIASYVDSLEDALYSTNFADTAIGYRKFLDLKSFIDYFLVNEISRNMDGFKKSVFFHKDKYSNGGKLKAGPVWDFDWAWKNNFLCFISNVTDGSGWAHHINDCGSDNHSCGWYIRMFQDTTFNEELRCTYENYRQTIFDTAYIYSYIDSMGSVVQNAQARHFQKFPMLGLSGPTPELGPTATTYHAELDTLKAWINLRLQWLDANIPGLCTSTTHTMEQTNAISPLQFFPNPAAGTIHFKGFMHGNETSELAIYDATGRLIDLVYLHAGAIQFDYQLKKGVYHFTITNRKGLLQRNKLVIL